MTAQAILPSNPADPTAQDKRERGALLQLKKRFNGIKRGMLAILHAQPYTTAETNAEHLAGLVLNWAAQDCPNGTGLAERITELAAQYNATEYQFLLDENVLSRINSEIGSLIDEWLLEGGPSELWLWNAYAFGAYQQGTAMSRANLAVQSPDYARAKPDLESILYSEPYRRRLGLVKARVFEEMRGLSERAKADLGAVLTRGMAAGQNPLRIARDIEERIGVNRSRANLIARTEITNALRTARLDEDQAAKDMGIQIKQMHFSALSPTTRPDHSARHGNLYTEQQQREFWSVAGNACNCKCSSIAIVVGDDGKPLNPATVERARKMRGD